MHDSRTETSAQILFESPYAERPGRDRNDAWMTAASCITGAKLVRRIFIVRISKLIDKETRRTEDFAPPTSDVPAEHDKVKIRALPWARQKIWTAEIGRNSGSANSAFQVRAPARSDNSSDQHAPANSLDLHAPLRSRPCHSRWQDGCVAAIGLVRGKG
jgi:hypothetical protein